MLSDLQHPKTVRHYNNSGHAHCLTFSCYQRRPLLSSEAVCILFLKYLVEVSRDLEYRLWAYVIMPNHVHLLVRPVHRQYSIAEFLKKLKGPCGYHALRVVRTQGADIPRFWQAGPGFDENVTDPGRAREMADYIHKNPVRKGLVSCTTDWRWSTARFWAGWEDCDLVMDEIC